MISQKLWAPQGIYEYYYHLKAHDHVTANFHPPPIPVIPSQLFFLPMASSVMRQSNGKWIVVGYMDTEMACSKDNAITYG